MKKVVNTGGLKGYITNTNLSNDIILENYRHLWQIEKAFRITKTDLRMRPIYHQLPHRIEAHICISFVACKVYKEPERKLKEWETNISAAKAIEIAENIFEIQIQSPVTKRKYGSQEKVSPVYKLILQSYQELYSVFQAQIAER